MAIYTNGKWNNVDGKYMVARSSKLKATDTGHLYDLIDTTNDVEQGCNLKVGAFTGNGLQERVALTPAITDQIVFACDTGLIYENAYKSDQFEWKYINKKNRDFRAYAIEKDDVFGVSDYGFTTIVNNEIAKGDYVVVDGSRKWKTVADEPSKTEYGFIGQVIGFEKYQYDTVVLVNVIQNIQL